MVLQTSVFLLFLLVPAGHSLSCYECVGVTAGSNIKMNVKDCSSDCANGSINFGTLQMTVTCCNTDQCNAKDAPDYSSAAPNGHRCFYCDTNSCSNTISCSGNEDHCIKAKGTFETHSKDVKGCASRSICEATSMKSVENISCCSGNLCNDAKPMTHSFLFLCFCFISCLKLI
ncbi:hypothetical protein DNTS_004654 [Danionella cerebrum]|uniref:UPAR/Ly6 domain-containing protein n=1 Tax=Danionella cerebrum TaxID=2873325 RepID=A0A553QYY0_9TELE|nr:hypothetical protein DNTS_004654 [Danionella translucida]TRY94979.1 hypothetical protein DNTS_004654 [Danionella translucida]